MTSWHTGISNQHLPACWNWSRLQSSNTQ